MIYFSKLFWKGNRLLSVFQHSKSMIVMKKWKSTFCSEFFKDQEKMFQNFRKNDGFWLAKNWPTPNKKKCYQRILPKFLVPTQIFFPLWSTIFSNYHHFKFEKMPFLMKIAGFMQKMQRNRFAELCKLHFKNSFRWGELTPIKINLKTNAA